MPLLDEVQSLSANPSVRGVVTTQGIKMVDNLVNMQDEGEVLAKEAAESMLDELNGKVSMEEAKGADDDLTFKEKHFSLIQKLGLDETTHTYSSLFRPFTLTKETARGLGEYVQIKASKALGANLGREGQTNPSECISGLNPFYTPKRGDLSGLKILPQKYEEKIEDESHASAIKPLLLIHKRLRALVENNFDEKSMRHAMMYLVILDEILDRLIKDPRGQSLYEVHLLVNRFKESIKHSKDPGVSAVIVDTTRQRVHKELHVFDVASMELINGQRGLIGSDNSTFKYGDKKDSCVLFKGDFEPTQENMRAYLQENNIEHGYYFFNDKLYYIDNENLLSPDKILIRELGIPSEDREILLAYLGLNNADMPMHQLSEEDLEAIKTVVKHWPGIDDSFEHLLTISADYLREELSSQCLDEFSESVRINITRARNKIDDAIANGFGGTKIASGGVTFAEPYKQDMYNLYLAHVRDKKRIIPPEDLVRELNALCPNALRGHHKEFIKCLVLAYRFSMMLEEFNGLQAITKNMGALYDIMVAPVFQHHLQRLTDLIRDSEGVLSDLKGSKDHDYKADKYLKEAGSAVHVLEADARYMLKEMLMRDSLRARHLEFHDQVQDAVESMSSRLDSDDTVGLDDKAKITSLLRYTAQQANLRLMQPFSENVSQVQITELDPSKRTPISALQRSVVETVKSDLFDEKMEGSKVSGLIRCVENGFSDVFVEHQMTKRYSTNGLIQNADNETANNAVIELLKSANKINQALRRPNGISNQEMLQLLTDQKNKIDSLCSALESSNINSEVVAKFREQSEQVEIQIQAIQSSERSTLAKVRTSDVDMAEKVEEKRVAVQPNPEIQQVFHNLALAALYLSGDSHILGDHVRDIPSGGDIPDLENSAIYRAYQAHLAGEEYKCDTNLDVGISVKVEGSDRQTLIRNISGFVNGLTNLNTRYVDCIQKLNVLWNKYDELKRDYNELMRSGHATEEQYQNLEKGMQNLIGTPSQPGKIAEVTGLLSSLQDDIGRLPQNKDELLSRISPSSQVSKELKTASERDTSSSLLALGAQTKRVLTAELKKISLDLPDVSSLASHTVELSRVPSEVSSMQATCAELRRKQEEKQAEEKREQARRGARKQEIVSAESEMERQIDDQYQKEKELTQNPNSKPDEYKRFQRIISEQKEARLHHYQEDDFVRSAKSVLDNALTNLRNTLEARKAELNPKGLFARKPDKVTAKIIQGEIDELKRQIDQFDSRVMTGMGRIDAILLDVSERFIHFTRDHRELASTAYHAMLQEVRDCIVEAATDCNDPGILAFINRIGQEIDRVEREDLPVEDSARIRKRFEAVEGLIKSSPFAEEDQESKTAEENLARLDRLLAGSSSAPANVNVNADAPQQQQVVQITVRGPGRSSPPQ